MKREGWGVWDRDMWKIAVESYSNVSLFDMDYVMVFDVDERTGKII